MELMIIFSFFKDEIIVIFITNLHLNRIMVAIIRKDFKFTSFIELCNFLSSISYAQILVGISSGEGGKT